MKIKARAWDREAECMVYPDTDDYMFAFEDGVLKAWYLIAGDALADEPVYGGWKELEDPPMLWTGGVDKKGVEIYARDVALSYNIREDQAVPVEVVWCNHFWALRLPDGSVTGMATPSGRFGIEVIGNSFESPELLTEKPNA